MRFNVFGAILALAGEFLAASSLGQVTANSKGYLFRVKFVQGRKYNYSVLSVVKVPNGQPTKVTGPFTLNVIQALPDGGVVEGAFGPLQSKGQPIMKRQTFRYRETNLGTFPSTSVVQQMSVPFVKEPKRIGESWDAQTSVKAVGSNSTVKAHYTLLGMTTINGHRVAKLSAILSSTGQTDTKGTGTIYILAEDGSLYSDSFVTTLTVPNTGVLHSTMNLTRT